MLKRRTVRELAIGGAEGEASREVARCEYRRGILVGVRDLGGGVPVGETVSTGSVLLSSAVVGGRAEGEPVIVGR